jgi:NAD(P)-dependent dehydrogenase (short-subunit alcohol dehydrogenase family)
MSTDDNCKEDRSGDRRQQRHRPGNFAESQWSRMYCKAALNMLTIHLAYELRGTKIKVNSANPGYTKTDLNDNKGTQPVEVGAIEATRLALLDDSDPTGGAFSKDGPDPW